LVEGVERTWVFYVTPAGREVVRQDLKALHKNARLEIGKAMDRLERGVPFPGEIKVVRREVRELRVGFEGLAYRLLYTHAGRGDRLLIALVLVDKRSQRLQERHIDLAEKRRTDWLRRHPDEAGAP
jgi:phage-related protein